jgi:hypothetical protein
VCCLGSASHHRILLHTALTPIHTTLLLYYFTTILLRSNFVPRISGTNYSVSRIYISSSAPQSERMLPPGGRFLRAICMNALSASPPYAPPHHYYYLYHLIFTTTICTAYFTTTICTALSAFPPYQPSTPY